MKGLKVKSGIRAPALPPHLHGLVMLAPGEPHPRQPCPDCRYERAMGQEFLGTDRSKGAARLDPDAVAIQVKHFGFFERRPPVPPGCTSGYAERTADRMCLELLRAYNLADGREARVFDATQVARTWVRRLLQDAEQIAAAEGTQGAARLRAMGEPT